MSTSQDNILLVPTYLDALVVPSTGQSVAAPLADFSKLYNTSLGELEYISENIVTQPLNEEEDNITLQPGAHLHWAMPDALTVGYTIGETSNYPPVPNRWLITRTTNGVITQWVVESDYIYPVSSPGTLPPSLPSNGATNFFIPRGSNNTNSCRYMGRYYSTTNDKITNDPSGDYLYSTFGQHLTAIGYGIPSFASFYPNCFSVFGFCDETIDTSVENQYEILGWYHSPDADCLNFISQLLESGSGKPIDYDILQSEFDWMVSSSDQQNPFPVGTVCYSRLTLSPNLAPNPNKETNANIAIGNSGTEALSAFVGENLAGSNQANKPLLEDQLEAVSFAQLKSEKADIGPSFFAARHQKTFKSKHGGTLWSVGIHSTVNSATSSQNTAPATLPYPFADAINELNLAQQAYDTATQDIISMQQQVFCDWYKDILNLFMANPHFPSFPVLIHYITRTSLYYLNSALDEAGFLNIENGQPTAFDSKNNKLATICNQGLQTSSTAPINNLAYTLLLKMDAVLQLIQQYNASSKTQDIAYQLVEKAAPRYWQPKDPTILISGNAVPSSEKFGEDGNLLCHILPLPDAIIPNHLSTIRTAVSNLPSTLPNGNPAPGLNTQITQPWHPIMLEWEISLSANQNGMTKIDNLDDFSSKFITSNYNLSPSGSTTDDLIINPNQPKISTSNSQSITGRNILTPHASLQLQNDLSNYLKDVTLADCIELGVPTKANNTQLLSWYEKQHTVSSPPDPSNLQAFKTWCTQQYVFCQDSSMSLPLEQRMLLDWNGIATWYSEKPVYFKISATTNITSNEPQVYPDPIYTAVCGYNVVDPSLGSPLQILSQQLEGFNEALLTKKHTLQLPVAEPDQDPSSQQYALTQAVATAVANNNIIAPNPNEPFLPIRTGLFKFNQIRLVDSYGQYQDLDIGTPTISDTMTNPNYPSSTYPGYAYLPPRITQPSRINVRFLSANSDIAESNDHPASSPICGWILPNNFNSSLMFYDAMGQAQGSIGQDALWQSTPGDLLVPGYSASNPYLQGVVNLLKSYPNAPPPIPPGISPKVKFIGNLITVLDQSLAAINPENYAQNQALSLLMGRPIAIIRAQISLDVQGILAINESWEAFENDVSNFCGQEPECVGGPDTTGSFNSSRSHNNFENVNFPIAIGEAGRVNDGVIGYWLGDSGTFENDISSTFYAPKISQSLPQIKTGTDAYLTTNLSSEPITVTMLVDPRGNINVNTGILPSKMLNIPTEQYSAALKNIAVTFLTAPLLTPSDEIHLSLSTEPGYTWSWIDPIEGQTSQIKKTTTTPTWNQVNRLVEGWLNLAPSNEEE